MNKNREEKSWAELLNSKVKKKEEKDYEKVADLLYPTMKDKKRGGLTGGAAKVEEEKMKKNTNTLENDKNFIEALDFVYKNEGGYSNHKEDKGGATNFGVTQRTYDDYCRRNNLTPKNVKDLTKDETVQIYYDDYWKKSGADKANNIFESIVLFDTAVLHGVGKAKSFYQKANGNPYEILSLRKEHYKQKIEDDESQMKFFNGWNNRVNRLEKMLNRAKDVNQIE